MIRAATLAMMLALPAVAEAPVSFGTLEIEVKGIAAITGTLNVGVHDSSGTFPDGSKAPLKASAVKTVSNPQLIVIEHVPYGVHAVSVWHDADGDGEMKKGLFGIPKEPIGVSNNVHSKLGPPSFDDARFEMKAPKQKLVIEVFVP
jgi:uncharacterized protein (DUF2141 family)